jgi:hypothetical protein
VQRVEKGLGKLVKATAPVSKTHAPDANSAAALAEMELVRKRERRMRKDLEDRERELSILRTAVSK